MSKIKAVIFDMDGVLIDSEPVYCKHILDFLHQDGVAVEISQLYNIVGSSSDKTEEMIYEFYNHSCTFEEFRTKFRKHSYAPVEYAEIKNKHLPSVLDQLKKMNIKIGVASSSPLADIEAAMDACGIRSYMDSILSGHMFKESKPNPEIYLKSAESLGVSVDECVVVEDSVYGIKAGKSAGMFVLAKEELRFNFEQTEADRIIQDLDEVLQYI